MIERINYHTKYKQNWFNKKNNPVYEECAHVRFMQEQARLRDRYTTPSNIICHCQKCRNLLGGLS